MATEDVCSAHFIGIAKPRTVFGPNTQNENDPMNF